MTEVQGFYSGCCVFVTGATGFLGAILIEKLVRSCPDINHIYILMREKKQSSVEDRFKQLLKLPVFERLSKESKAKIIPVPGDLNLINLGLSIEDVETLQRNVSVVFHTAAIANSRFIETIETNVLGTRRVLQLAQTLPLIKSFVYISTAFVNCIPLEQTQEKVYLSKWTPDELVNSKYVDEFDVPSVQKRVTGGQPNPYSFSKLMAENLVHDERGNISVAVVRPSIVLGTLKEPMPGWVDEVYNEELAFIAGAYTGLLRTLNAEPDFLTDMVPSDYLVSLVITTAYAAYKERSFKIYHLTSGMKNPMTWGLFCEMSMQGINEYPLMKEIIYPKAKCRPSSLKNRLQVYISHYVPAVIFDVITMLTLENPIHLNMQKKYSKRMELGRHYTLNQFSFSTSNTDLLLQSLSQQDRKEFNFDVTNINWKRYIDDCVLGVRLYYHKEDLSQINEARQSHQANIVIYYVFWLMLVWFFWIILAPLGKCSLPAATTIVLLYYLL